MTAGTKAVEAARHICEEARIVLSSLRGGPPIVASGELAQNLRHLRVYVRSRFLSASGGQGGVNRRGAGQEEEEEEVHQQEEEELQHEQQQGLYQNRLSLSAPTTPTKRPVVAPPTSNTPDVVARDCRVPVEASGAPPLPSTTRTPPVSMRSSRANTAVQQASPSTGYVTVDAVDNDAPAVPPLSPAPHAVLDGNAEAEADAAAVEATPAGSDPRGDMDSNYAGVFATPFLAVVMDPRAAGPHTLVALRALHRLLERGSLVQVSSEDEQRKEEDGTAHFRHTVSLEPLMRGVLACKFEQTDAGADEAVEMAIADMLALMILKLDMGSARPDTLLEAFNTVFVTRNTFVHSPALCYHFEEVLTGMVTAVFSAVADNRDVDQGVAAAAAARLIMEFLVNQLLHTPINAGGNAAGAEAHAAHDDTRILCLRLAQCCLRTGWGGGKSIVADEVTGVGAVESSPGAAALNWERRALLQLIQDDLCLALLVLGQAMWTYRDVVGATGGMSSAATGNSRAGATSPSHLSSSNASSGIGIISLELLSEICSTISTLWNVRKLRSFLLPQFEAIFAGFYQRGLSLLRRLPVPSDISAFNANQIFDAEVEIILESLVDLVCLHCNENEGGGRVDDIADGDNMEGADLSGGVLQKLFVTYDCSLNRSDVASGIIAELCRCCGAYVGTDGESFLSPGGSDAAAPPSSGSSHAKAEEVDDEAEMYDSPHGEIVRQVPSHLKELCAQALLGSMKRLFSDFRGSSAVEGTADSSPVDVAKESSWHVLKRQKRSMRKAALLFNEKSSKGFQFLLDSGLLPSPPTPLSVARFLRDGLVVGLDKKAVGEYLGAVGKGASPGKSPSVWERDWFHKEALSTYCSLFRFEHQSLLDGLRMFLAAFRLPGEAQQIDRILQAFAESCGRKCEESSTGQLKLFSPDEKRASDAAYLLSFSIIMLNTDLHNDNIRADRKMKVDDFVRNNTNYGKDITEEGRELPREYLVSIYDSIKEEQIRTEGEGAEGEMTVERWKDVLRSAEGPNGGVLRISEGGEDDQLKGLLLESVFMPVLSAVCGLWGFTPAGDAVDYRFARSFSQDGAGSIAGANASNVQGARLGMDLSLEMISGVRNMGRTDLFRQVFIQVCHCSGLLDDYSTDAGDRTSSFVHSVERQSAVVVAMNTARDAGDSLGPEGWKCVWAMIFELRDLRLIGSGTSGRSSLLFESEADLLRAESRKEWKTRLLRQGLDGSTAASLGNDGGAQRSTMTMMFGAMGRALFGSDDTLEQNQTEEASSAPRGLRLPTPHGKEELLLWDDVAPSDDEASVEDGDERDVPKISPAFPAGAHRQSAGTLFERQVMHEDYLMHSHAEEPVTGLETVEDTKGYQPSPRARVRQRLSVLCDFSGLIDESRFLDIAGIQHLLGALVAIIHAAEDANAAMLESSGSDGDPNGSTDALNDAVLSPSPLPLSPASEAFAEVTLCEVALRNRDRLATIWRTVLRSHYLRRLGTLSYQALFNPVSADQSRTEAEQSLWTASTAPGIEKCAAGFIRVCCTCVQKEDLADEVLSQLKVLYPPNGRWRWEAQYLNLDRHFAEGLWRICRSVDALRHVGREGWEGLLGLVEWCSGRGQPIPLRPSLGGRGGGLSEDDPALQAFRTLHLMLHSADLKDVVPFRVVDCVRSLVRGGERQNCPMLCIAGLELLSLLHARLETRIANAEDWSVVDGEGECEAWVKWWLSVFHGMSDAAETSRYPGVRERALSMLTDSIVDGKGQSIPREELRTVVGGTCVPLAGKRIRALLSTGVEEIAGQNVEQILIEFELCISLLFKPFLHHLKELVTLEASFVTIWMSMLSVMTDLLGEPLEGIDYDDDDNDDVRSNDPNYEADSTRTLTRRKLLKTTRELGSEHLRNAVMVLIACGVLKGTGAETGPEDFSGMTWSAIENMEFCRVHVAEWRASANATAGVMRNEQAEQSSVSMPKE